MVFAAFELKVDSLMSLRINYTDTLPLYNIALGNGTTPAVVSAVMFRCAQCYNPCISPEVSILSGHFEVLLNSIAVLLGVDTAQRLDILSVPRGM